MDICKGETFNKKKKVQTQSQLANEKIYKRETSGYNQRDIYNINKQKENQDKINRTLEIYKRGKAGYNKHEEHKVNKLMKINKRGYINQDVD